MGNESVIEWTDSTWNPWRGCDKVSPGCSDCYMFRDQLRYGRDPSKVIRCSDGTFFAPVRSRKWAETREACIAARGRHLVFTCSWSDWFHEDADPWREEAWQVIRESPRSVYQVLTKRPERIAECLPADWGDGYPNVWLGTTIENRRFVDRADLLRAVPAAVRFISAEPLLGPLIFDGEFMEPGTGARYGCWADDTGTQIVGGRYGMEPSEDNSYARNLLPELDLTGIDWLIAGGESGGRPGRALVERTDRMWSVKPEGLRWVVNLRDACAAAGTAFLFKQWGGSKPTSAGRTLEGRTYDELPESPVLMAT